MSTNRRAFFSRLAVASSGLAGMRLMARTATSPRQPALFETPDSPKLPWTMSGGWKEFHLVADVVRTEFLPGRPVDAWGYNGTVPGPVIEANEGDKVRIVVDNHLPEATSMHWHGLEIPVGMDGVPGVVQDPIAPGERFIYEFELNQNGTFFYHSHMPMQEMMGMIGFFIIHPRVPHDPPVDKDFGIILQEWAILPNNTVPNTLAMEYNWLTMNGKAGPATTPLIAKTGDRVRVRLVNLGMDHHPIHLHGNTFSVTGSEAGRIPQSAWAPANTVLVGVAQARDIEFDAKYPGDWMLHCHMPHHGMNQMASMVGPMTRPGSGMGTGGGMDEGMGMLRQGNALSESAGPSLGRGLGIASDAERPVSNMSAQNMPDHNMQGHNMQGHDMSGMHHQMGASPSTSRVPGYPQDMWMVMDDDYASKPECFGLRPGWTGGMMGMMTLIRVLPPDLYDKIQALRAQKSGQPKEQKPSEGHHHHAG